MRSNNKVEFEVKLIHKNPISLTEMANSLISLDNLSKQYISKEYGVKDTTILLEGVKEGSDIYKIVLDVGICTLPLINGTDSIVQILEYLKSYLNLSKHSTDELIDNRHYNTINAESVKTLIAPIEDNNIDSSMSFNIPGNNNNIFVINSNDKQKIHKNIEVIKKLESTKEEDTKETKYYNKLIKMHKATNTSRKVRDSAYCDEIIQDKAIPTLIENNDDKQEILQDPFNNYFLVDIEVSRIDDEIKLYRVIKLHSIVPFEIE